MIDLGVLEDGKFYGEFTLKFEDGVLVQVKKVESFKPVQKTIDLSVVIVLR